MGLPRVKSKMFSAPCSFFSLSPSSNIALIQDEFSMSPEILFDMTIFYLPPAYCLPMRKNPGIAFLIVSRGTQ